MFPFVIIVTTPIKQIISPKDSKPIIGIVQDTLLGVFRLTQDNVRLLPKQAYNIQMVNSRFFH